MIRALQHQPLPPLETGTHSSPEACAYVGWVAHPGSFAASQSGHDEPAGVQLAFAGECLSHDGVDFEGANRRFRPFIGTEVLH